MIPTFTYSYNLACSDVRCFSANIFDGKPHNQPNLALQTGIGFVIHLFTSLRPPLLCVPANNFKEENL